jgi:hypothetical protein
VNETATDLTNSVRLVHVLDTHKACHVPLKRRPTVMLELQFLLDCQDVSSNLHILRNVFLCDRAHVATQMLALEFNR